MLVAGSFRTPVYYRKGVKIVNGGQLVCVHPETGKEYIGDWGFYFGDLKRWTHFITHFQATGGVRIGWRPGLEAEKRPDVCIAVLIFSMSVEMAGALAMEMANAPKFSPSVLDSESRRGRSKYKERKETIDLEERDAICNWNM